MVLLPTVVERAPALRSGGYAIDLREILFVDGNNQTLASMSANYGAGGGETGDVELLRDDLAQILYAVTRNDVDNRFGDSVTALNQYDDGVDVTFARGASASFDFVIGADGAHSNIRALCMFASPSRVYDDRDVDRQKDIAAEYFVAEPGWHFARLLTETRGATDFYFDNISRIRTPRRSSGRVALVGDAACAAHLEHGSRHRYGGHWCLRAGGRTGACRR